MGLPLSRVSRSWADPLLPWPNLWLSVPLAGGGRDNACFLLVILTSDGGSEGEMYRTGGAPLWTTYLGTWVRGFYSLLYG